MSIAIVALLNGVILGLLLEFVSLFNVVRACIAVWAGWLIVTTSNGNKRLWFAAAGGVWVMAVDHLFLTSSSMTIAQLLGLSPFAANQLPLALLGVVISFIMFSPIAALFGAGGGLIARRGLKRDL